jgi:hypothetical protein
MAPITIQTISNQKGDPSDFAIPAGVRKMPTPIISPTTTAVAEANPRCLLRDVSVFTQLGPGKS